MVSGSGDPIGNFSGRFHNGQQFNMSEGKYINRFRWITLISGGVLILLIILAWINSTWLPSWKKYQKDYYRIALEQSEEDDLKPEPSAIRQVVSPGLRRTDRCINCHLGL